jgi:hypothetical protein
MLDNQATTDHTTPAQIAQYIRNPMFSDRDTIDEAYDYFFKVIKTINDADRAAALTATQVLINTIANKIEPQTTPQKGT